MEKNSLLEEALNRHKMIMEYQFYVPMAEDEVYEGLEEQEEELTPEEPVAGEVELTPEEPVAGEEELTPEEPVAGEEELTPEEPIGGEEIDVDVTALVDKAEEAKEEVMSAVTTKMDDLMGKLSDLESKVGGMDQLLSKISSLEAEIKERNPTPKEKLELRSLDSYPYNVKLTDFWQDKGMLDTEDDDKTEYTLTDDDVKLDYDEVNIKNSFDKNEDNTSVFATA